MTKRIVILLCLLAAFANLNAEEKMEVPTNDWNFTYALASKQGAKAGRQTIFRDITTEKSGDLLAMLGDDLYVVDSISVSGPIGVDDFKTMWDASYNGSLKAINLEFATIDNGTIPDNAFWHQEEQVNPNEEVIYTISLKNIILPEGVTRIGEKAFAYATKLEKINFPSTLEFIGNASFTDCISLSNNPLTIPDGISEIGGFTFYNCSNLKGTVVLPSTIRLIGDSAFYNTGIETCNFPDGLQSIGDAAFYGANLKEVNLPSSCCEFYGASQFQQNAQLTKVHLPEGMTYIPERFLNMCVHLQSINIPSSVTEIKSYALNACMDIDEILLSEGLKRIGDHALWGLHRIKSICFPSTLEYLGTGSCEQMAGLEAIYSASPNPPTCDYEVGDENHTPFGPYESTYFLYTPPTASLYVPVGSREPYSKTYGWDYFYDIIETNEFPQASFSEVTVEDESVRQCYFDLMGRCVANPIPGHIYIKNGVKLIYR